MKDDKLALKLSKLIPFLLLAVPFLVAGVVVYLLFMPVKRTRVRVQAFCCMIWGRLSCRLVGIRVSRSGRYKDTASGFIVSNHVSYIDILVMAGVRPSVFVSKMDVKGWPLLGWLARLGGTIFIERERKVAAARALSDVGWVLDSGVNVIVFPEGTTSDGTSARDFRSMFFDVPARKDVPVIPLTISYTQGGGKETPLAPWFDDTPFGEHAWRFLGARDVEAKIYFSPVIYRTNLADEPGSIRKALASKSHESVQAGLEKLRGHGGEDGAGVREGAYLV